MYILKVNTHFDAAHRLPDYNGPCRHIHGHRWVIHATYRFDHNLTQGMCYDLVHLKRELHDVVSMYDHVSLNDLMAVTPTAENIARVIYNRLCARALPVHKEHLWAVKVNETPDCSAAYCPHLSDTGIVNSRPVAVEEPAKVKAEAEIKATLTVDKAQVGITDKNEPASK